MTNKSNDTPPQGKNIINSPDARKELKAQLSAITHYFQAMDDAREGASEAIMSIASQYGINKKMLRKMARSMYKHDYNTVQEENRHFEEMYEIVVEGRYREDPDGIALIGNAADDPNDED